MDESRSVLPDGIVYIEAQSIVAVQPVDEEAPAGFEDVEVIEVDGTIYPGLVEALTVTSTTMRCPCGRWRRAGFTNRDQWPRDPAYRAAVSNPARVLDQQAPLAAMRRGEARCLAAGVTTSTGRPRHAAVRQPGDTDRRRVPAPEAAARRRADDVHQRPRDTPCDVQAKLRPHEVVLPPPSSGRRHLLCLPARSSTPCRPRMVPGRSPRFLLALVHATALGARELAEILKEHGGSIGPDSAAS